MDLGYSCGCSTSDGDPWDFRSVNVKPFLSQAKGKATSGSRSQAGFKPMFSLFAFCQTYGDANYRDQPAEARNTIEKNMPFVHKLLHMRLSGCVSFKLPAFL